MRHEGEIRSRRYRTHTRRLRRGRGPSRPAAAGAGLDHLVAERVVGDGSRSGDAGGVADAGRSVGRNNRGDAAGDAQGGGAQRCGGGMA
jgi:hypothetical protein